MRRRLFQRLEQCIERFRRQHVYFINNIDFASYLGRCIFHLIPQITNLLYTAVGCSINLLHIHDRPRRNSNTGLAFITRLYRRPTLTVDCLGQNLGCTGLSCAPRPTEQIGVRGPPVANSILQGLDNMLLSYHVLERLGSPSTV
ncbi:hypothetical protein D1872_250860 [compost metagenome]